MYCVVPTANIVLPIFKVTSKLSNIVHDVTINSILGAFIRSYRYNWIVNLPIYILFMNIIYFCKGYGTRAYTY